MHLANLISLVRIPLALAVVLLLVVSDSTMAWWWAVGLTSLSYVSDLLDGWVAKVMSEDSRLGRILDPLTDKIFILSLLTVFVWMDVIHFAALILIVTRELVYLAFKSGEEKSRSGDLMGKIKTGLQFIGFIAVIAGINFVNSGVAIGEMLRSEGIIAIWLSIPFGYLSLIKLLKK